MPNALVVADDLTGAMDTGHGFAARGRAVRVRRSTGTGRAGDDAGPDSGVLVVDTDSRDADPASAAAAVREAVERHPADLVYKKVDSTLRGNPVTEMDAALAATGADLAVVAPAFPATGRTTEDGRHLVDGVALAEAGYGVDESDLRAVFGRSASPVDHLGRAVVDAGADAVADRLGAVAAAGGGGPGVVACDARTDRHLASVAEGASAADPAVLYVGSGGLAAHVDAPGRPRADRAGDSVDAVSSDSGGGALGVVGSVNERTLAQLAAVDPGLVVRLDPAAAVRDPAETGRAAAGALAETLEGRGRAVVTAATDPSDVTAAERAVDATEGDAGAVAADRVGAALAAAARATVARADPGGLVLTGGDVARAVLDALDAEAVALAGEAVGAGVPLGRIATGQAAGTAVATKAGGFGGERVILNCLDAMAP